MISHCLTIPQFIYCYHGCLLATVINAAENICVQVFCMICVFNSPGIHYLEVDFLDHMVTLCLVF